MSRRRKQQQRGSTAASSADTHDRATVTPNRWNRRAVATALGLALLVVVSYVPIFSAGYIWDDNDHLPHSELQRSATGLQLVWTKLGATPQYYPLTHTTFWLESQIWGLHPVGYHVVNVLLHACSVILLWRILLRLAVPGALVAAAIFAVHPVHVESVAWVSERKNILSGFFYLSAALCYLRSIGISGADAAPGASGSGPPPGSSSTREPRSWPWYVLAVLLFCCAVLSKTVTSSLPAALCLVLWWKHRLNRRQILLLLPMFVFGIAMGRITADMERWNVGAVGQHFDWTFTERLLIAGRAVWFYASKLLAPVNLMFVYPRWTIDAHLWWQYLFPVAAIALVGIGVFISRRHGRGFLIAILFFGGTLFPALGFVNVYPMRFSYVADHFQYLASIGLIVLLVAIAARRWPRAALRVRAGVAWAVVLLLAFLTWRETFRFRDAETLWRDTLARNPNAWMAHTNLAAMLIDRGDLTEAEHHLQEALRIQPVQGLTQVIWGQLLQRQDNFDGAERLYRDAMAKEPTDVTPHFRLGMLFLARRNPDAAIAEFNEALRLDERHEEARLELAGVLEQRGQASEALDHYARAIELNPYSLEARQRASLLLTRMGLLQQAIELLTEGLRYGGEDNAVYQNNLGVALLRAGRPTEAAVHFSRAIALKPSFAEATLNLGSAFQSNGDLSAAARQYRQALQINPNYETAREALRRLEGR